MNLGNEGIVKKLVASGVDVNSENEDGATAMYFAVRRSAYHNLIKNFIIDKL